MDKREEIREGFKDFICRLAKSDELDACENCEKLGLKLYCSIRHNANEYLNYLDSKGVVIKVETWLPARSGMTCTIEPLVGEGANESKVIQ